MSVRGGLTLFLTLLLPSTTPAGEFDRVEGDRLERLIRDGVVEPRQGLTVNALGAIPQAFKDVRSAFLVVKTGQGNLARLLVVPGFRKPPDGQGAAIPVVVLERFDTFEPGKSASRAARGANLILFEGFQLDLDTGQVVPEGQGGDLVFKADGKGGPRLESIGSARLYAAGRAIPAEPDAGGPSAGKAVEPGDFAGRYRLHADGRWTGRLELRVADDRSITGRFRSEPNGTSYPVTGEVAADAPGRATFTVRFPRTEQSYEAFLWTEGKWALAGTFRMADRSFGFFAVREGVKVETND